MHRHSRRLNQRLASLGSGAMDRLTRISRFQELPADSTICFEGDLAADIFVVSSGIVRVFKFLPDGRRQITRFLYAGDFLCVSADDRCGYGAEAATAVSLLSFRRSDLERAVEEAPEIRHMFLADTFSELAAAQDHMVLLGRKSASERVATFLLMLARRQATRAGGLARRLQIPLSASDVADYLGLTLETVSRTLSVFRRDGIINAYRSRREIDIVSREKLQDLSGESPR
jgi:CRP/FNR family transcriptional regulator